MSTYVAPGYCQELGRNCVDAKAEIERLRGDRERANRTAAALALDVAERDSLIAEYKAEIERLRALRRIEKYEPAPNDPHAEWTRQRQRDALIEQQSAEIERLKTALLQIAHDKTEIDYAQHIARAALEGKP